MVCSTLGAGDIPATVTLDSVAWKPGDTGTARHIRVTFTVALGTHLSVGVSISVDGTVADTFNPTANGQDYWDSLVTYAYGSNHTVCLATF